MSAKSSITQSDEIVFVSVLHYCECLLVRKCIACSIITATAVFAVEYFDRRLKIDKSTRFYFRLCCCCCVREQKNEQMSVWNEA